MTDFADLWPVKIRRDGQPKSLSQMKLEGQIDQVYRERAFVVAALAKMISDTTGHVWLGRHEGTECEDDWRWVVYIDLPGLAPHQVSWHIHDTELPLFAGLLRVTFKPGIRYGDAMWPDGRTAIMNIPWSDQCRYDGHTTDEKYRRLYAYVTG